MKFKRKIIFSAILIVIASASVIFSEINNKDYSILPFKNEVTADYFPIDSSLKLIYNSSFGEAYATIQQNGNNYVLDLSNDDFNFTQTVYFQNDTVYLTKLDQRVDVFLFISSKISVTYNRPYLRFPFPLKSNDDWAWNGIEFIDEKSPDSIMVVGKVLGEELIDTPAGKFNSVKFQIDIFKKKSGSHTKFYEWRTPQIGLVKLEAHIDSKGFIGKIMKVLGYDEMKFELKKIG